MAYKCSWSCPVMTRMVKMEIGPQSRGAVYLLGLPKLWGLLPQEVGFSRRRLSTPQPQAALPRTNPQTHRKHCSLRGGRTPGLREQGSPPPLPC